MPPKRKNNRYSSTNNKQPKNASKEICSRVSQEEEEYARSQNCEEANEELQKLLAAHNEQISSTGYVFIAVKQTDSHGPSLGPLQRGNDPLDSQDMLLDEQTMDEELYEQQPSPGSEKDGSSENDCLHDTNNSMEIMLGAPENQPNFTTLEFSGPSAKPTQTLATNFGIQSSFADLAVSRSSQEVQQNPTSSAHFISTGSNCQLPMVYLPSQQINLANQVQNKVLANSADSSGNPLKPSTKIQQIEDRTPYLVTGEPSQDSTYGMRLVQLSSQEIQHLQHTILGNTVCQIPDLTKSEFSQGNINQQANLNVPIVHVSTQRIEDKIRSPVDEQLLPLHVLPVCPEVAPTISIETPLGLATTSNAEKDKTNSTKDIEGDPECPKCDYFRGLGARRAAEMKRLRIKIAEMERERAQNADHTLSLSRELQDMKDGRKIPSANFTTEDSIDISLEEIKRIDNDSTTDSLFVSNLAIHFFGTERLMKMSVTGKPTPRFKNLLREDGTPLYPAREQIDPKFFKFICEKLTERVAMRLGPSKIKEVTYIADEKNVRKNLAQKISNLNKAAVRRT